MKLNFEGRRRCGALRSSNISTIGCFQRAAEKFPRLRFQVFFELLFPCVLLLNSPIRFLRDPIPYSAEALMIHEVRNKGFSKAILDLFVTCYFHFTSLFYKNSLRSSDREVSSHVTSIFDANVI